MSTIDAPLKYLFVAEYHDGSMFEQPADDRSKDYDATTDHNKSAFGDVEHHRLKRFHLVEQAEPQDVYSVDMESGAFAINGRPFDVHPQLFNPRDYKLRLIFFREARRETNMATGETISYINRYFIGWQCTDADGKNHQYTIAIR